MKGDVSYFLLSKVSQLVRLSVYADEEIFGHTAFSREHLNDCQLSLP